MKRLSFIAVILFLLIEVKGQNPFDPVSLRKNILDQVGKNGIEDLYLGCSDCISPSRALADSLFKTIPLDDALVYINNESYTVRYYAFLRVLALDDSAAYEYLKKHIEDSTKLDIVGACMMRMMRFNELIASDYRRFIHYKYKGQSFSIDGHTYMFDKPDRKTGKMRAKEFKKLTALYRIRVQD